MAKSLEVRKSFHFCVFSPMGVFKNQEDCPNYLALKDHSNKLKMPGRNILQFFFKKRAIVTLSSETQGNIAGARESLNGRENMARRKVKNGEFLRAIFSRSFRLSLAPTICPWVSEDVVTPGRGILPI